MARPGPPPNPRGLLKPRLQVKCTEEYHLAVLDRAGSLGLSAAEMVELALLDYLKRAKLAPLPCRA